MSPLAVSLRFLQTQPDARLVELARAGHERAFEALVRRYRGPLLAYCRRVAPRGTAPEDILQQGLLQAWKALSGGAEVRDGRAWLYRIVHNVAITALRASGELPQEMPPGAGATGVEALVEQRMAARDALAGLAALPDLQRQVMVSTALDGQSHEEIAAALGLTSGSVRGLIYRARSTLRAAAAAVIPAPVINWAVSETGGASATIAGASGAGLGALMLKGGAIVAVGAVAGTTAIVIDHHSRHVHLAKASPAAAVNGSAGGAPGSGASTKADRAAGASIVFTTGHRIAKGGARTSAGSRGGRSDGGSDQHGGSGDGSRGNGHGDGSSSGGDGSRSGHDGSGSGSGGGSGGGGDQGATVATRDGGEPTSDGLPSSSGSSDGGDHQTTTTSDGSNGGSSSSAGSSGGGSDGGTTTTTAATTAP